MCKFSLKSTRFAEELSLVYAAIKLKDIYAKSLMARGVIGEVRCGFLRIYAPTPYSAVFLFYAPAPAPTKIGLGAVRCGLMWCGVGAVLRFGLNSFGLD